MRIPPPTRRTLARLAFASIAFTFTASAAQIDIAGPPGSNAFGAAVAVLPNGNYVVIDAGGVGAAHLFSPKHVLISTLKGVTQGDFIDARITLLKNGNFVIATPLFDGLDDAGDIAANVGAVTFVSGTVGLDGIVDPSRSLVGGSALDRVGQRDIVPLSDGAYVVCTPLWDFGGLADAGAATWGSGATGVKGKITAQNSLIGGQANDRVCEYGARALHDGRYFVASPMWSAGGAVGAGAVTWVDGGAGPVGQVTEVNSLVGSQSDDAFGDKFEVLVNGNYVVGSGAWDNGAIADAGAAAWVNGSTGAPRGIVSSANALVGSHASDQIGDVKAIALSNGHYVIAAPFFDDTSTNVGAAIFGDGMVGTKGTVAENHALTGTNAEDRVGERVVALVNGNYLVVSPQWDDGALLNAGAVTWRSGSLHTSEMVSSSNSLVGNATGTLLSLDSSSVLNDPIAVLSNGNYALALAAFKHPADMSPRGAIVWADGTQPLVGSFATVERMEGSKQGDAIGSGGLLALDNGDYVVKSPQYDCIVPECLVTKSNVGAITYLSGTTPATGALTAANSTIGGFAGDSLGAEYSAALPDGKFLITCSNCDTPISNAGIVKRFTPSEGTHGIVGPAPEVFSGVTSGDVIAELSSVKKFANGALAFGSFQFDGPSGEVNAGAVTFVPPEDFDASQVSPANSVIGTIPLESIGGVFDFNPVSQQLIVGRPKANRVSILDVGPSVFSNGFEDVPLQQ